MIAQGRPHSRELPGAQTVASLGTRSVASELDLGKVQMSFVLAVGPTLLSSRASLRSGGDSRDAAKTI
jgi:hypothetical protein